MPVITTWENPEQTLICLKYEKPWDWTAFEEAIVNTNAMLDTVDHPVDMIIVMNDGLPREIGPQRFRKVANSFHPSVRATALVGVSDVIRWSITAFMSVLGQDHRTFFFAANMNDALKKLGHPLPASIEPVEVAEQPVMLRSE